MTAGRHELANNPQPRSGSERSCSDEQHPSSIKLTCQNKKKRLQIAATATGNH